MVGIVLSGTVSVPFTAPEDNPEDDFIAGQDSVPGVVDTDIPAEASIPGRFDFAVEIGGGPGEGAPPLTPGPDSSLVMVRLVNDTPDSIEFVVTAERQTLVVGDDGNTVVASTNETVRMRTVPVDVAKEIGALFDCPVTRIGLGEDIDRPFTEPGMFVVTGDQFGVGQGVGVPGNMAPLDSRAGNFECGDTLVIRAVESPGQAADLHVQPFVLPWSSQPEESPGPHTFDSVRIFLDEQEE